MGSVTVDQIEPSGAVIQHADVALSEGEKNDLLLNALPGGTVEVYGGVRAIRFRNQVILKAQVTHLGNPWPPFKKRIQIPKTWLRVERQAEADDLVVRFVGIYRHGSVTVFVDFDPRTYVLRKANSSAAHLATNDLFQAQTLGQFSRIDRNGNRLTSVRGDQFARYLQFGLKQQQPHVEVFRKFNADFLSGNQIEALDAIKEMYASSWPDTFQAEWPGFFVEYRLDSFIRSEGLAHLVEYRKVKQHGQFDYDLAFSGAAGLEYYGDLKASNVTKMETPGNDADDLRRCVNEFGRFWYVIYEHETKHARDHGDLATVSWNEWKMSVGRAVTPYNPLSYASRFKESVRFVRMVVLEVNEANYHVVLGDFAQGKQPSGASRALKVMIDKRNIDNFLIYAATARDC